MGSEHSMEWESEGPGQMSFDHGEDALVLSVDTIRNRIAHQLSPGEVSGAIWYGESEGFLREGAHTYADYLQADTALEQLEDALRDFVSENSVTTDLESAIAVFTDRQGHPLLTSSLFDNGSLYDFPDLPMTHWRRCVDPPKLEIGEDIDAGLIFAPPTPKQASELHLRIRTVLDTGDKAFISTTQRQSRGR